MRFFYRSNALRWNASGNAPALLSEQEDARASIVAFQRWSVGTMRNFFLGDLAAWRDEIFTRAKAQRRKVF
jgi:hypothetical protein